MALLAFGFAPGGLKRLSRDLDANRVAVQDIQVPPRMRVGAAFRCDDHDLATDVAVDQRPDIDLRGFATHTLDQAVRGDRTAPDRTHVQDVAPGATGGQIRLEVLADPVTSRRSDRRGIGVAHARLLNVDGGEGDWTELADFARRNHVTMRPPSLLGRLLTATSSSSGSTSD